MVSGSRMRQLGWMVSLTICFVLFVMLTFKVNSVKSQVRLAERELVSLQREKVLLETEFETRASQQQLSQWNAVDFGYEAPGADQYLEGERQLAALGEPRGPAAPAPIRVARAPEAGDGVPLPKMVSPLTGKPVHDPAPGEGATTLADTLAGGAGLMVEARP